MKKTVLAFLCLLCAVVIAGAALAQENAHSDIKDNFILNDCITWDSDYTDLVRCMGQPNPEYSSEHDGFEEYYYLDQPVSNYTAGELGFVFRNRKLIVVNYNLYDLQQSDFAYILVALSAVYGSPAKNDMARYIRIMNALGYQITYEEYLEYAPDLLFVNWALDDGTFIVASFDDGYVSIAYLNEDRILEMEFVNTTGL